MMDADSPLTLPPPAQAGEKGERLGLRMFWYVACASEELRAGGVLGRRVLGESLALFRVLDGTPRALEDRCLHRAAPLSSGSCRDGRLRCSYHGWAYDGAGRVVDVPSLGGACGKIGHRAARAVEAVEQDGYVYVRLERPGLGETRPFPMPRYGETPWRRVRLLNVFRNNVTNCAENFVDIPHTAFVHPGIFRVPQGRRISARVTRRDGAVTADYRGETTNLGWFSRFLNPSGGEIRHVDRFLMPNVTCVEYEFGPRRRFVITSQSVPVSELETWVYTDLSYDYGIWNAVAGPVVRRQGQKVIDQDVAILARQAEVLRRLPPGSRPEDCFTHTPADVIHVFIESIRRELEAGRDPRALPDADRDIEFFV